MTAKLIEESPTAGQEAVAIECVGETVADCVEGSMGATGKVDGQYGHEDKVHEGWQDDPPGVGNEAAAVPVCHTAHVEHSGPDDS